MKDEIKFEIATRDYAVYVNGDLQGYRPTITEALELQDEARARYRRQGLMRTIGKEIVADRVSCESKQLTW